MRDAKSPIIKRWILEPLFDKNGGLTEVSIKDGFDQFRMCMIHVDLIFGERMDWNTSIWAKLKRGEEVTVTVHISEYSGRNS